MSLLIEKKSRRAELALYTMPRAADSLLLALTQRRWVPSVRFGAPLSRVWQDSRPWSHLRRSQDYARCQPAVTPVTGIWSACDRRLGSTVYTCNTQQICAKMPSAARSASITLQPC